MPPPPETAIRNALAFGAFHGDIATQPSGSTAIVKERRCGGSDYRLGNDGLRRPESLTSASITHMATIRQLTWMAVSGNSVLCLRPVQCYAERDKLDCEIQMRHSQL